MHMSPVQAPFTGDGYGHFDGDGPIVRTGQVLECWKA